MSILVTVYLTNLKTFSYALGTTHCKSNIYHSQILVTSIWIYLYDMIQFGRHSGVMQKYSNRVQLRGIITVHSHGIEKGLSLKNTRPGFGQWHVCGVLA